MGPGSKRAPWGVLVVAGVLGAASGCLPCREGEARVDGTCRRMCNADSDCLGTEHCEGGSCVDGAPEVDARSSSTGVPGGSSSTAASAPSASLASSDDGTSGLSGPSSSGTSGTTDTSTSRPGGTSSGPGSTSSGAPSGPIVVRGAVVAGAAAGSASGITVRGTVVSHPRVRLVTPDGVVTEGHVQ